MTLANLHKFPAPYFGGKTDAAPAIWQALGDVDHYVDPFCGSCANLLLRPHPCNRTYFSETVNDADGMLVNALRSLRLHPDATAEAASVQVSECELTAIHLWLVAWSRAGNVERLMADPEWCDPVAGGRWLWGLSAWIGSGWCTGDGPWHVGPDGRITNETGSGGVSQSREPGVSKKRPHLSHAGRGVNRPQSREPGVNKQLPHLSNNGQGVNHAGTREPGVSKQRPHLGDNGQGVNHAGTREPGVGEPAPDSEFIWQESDFHPMTMPELRRWFAFLSARLRHVRIICGDWRRAVTTGAACTLPVRQGGHVGVFLDPPYGDAASRNMGLYRMESGSVAADVREWCLANGDDKRFRIVLAGFEGEGHEELERAGWRVVEWFKSGWLKGGMGQQSEKNADDEPTHQQARERLWASPHCLRPDTEPSLFGSLLD